MKPFIMTCTTRTITAAIAYSGAVALLAVSLLTAAPARAQDPSDRVDEVLINFPTTLRTANVDADARRYRINLEDCRDLVADRDEDITVTWNFDRSAPSDAEYTLKVQLDGETCNLSSLITEANDECITLEQQVSFGGDDTVREATTWQELSGFTSADLCDGSSLIIDLALVFTSFNVSGDSEDDTDNDVTRFELVTSRPTAPVNVDAEAGESSLRVDWSEVAAAEAYDVYYSTTPFSTGDDPEDIDAESEQVEGESVVLDDGIVVDATYYIGVSSIDDVGNASLMSTVVTVSTQPVIDFYEQYRIEGGVEEGGYCAVASAGQEPRQLGLLLVGLALGAWFLRRRYRRRQEVAS